MGRDAPGKQAQITRSGPISEDLPGMPGSHPAAYGGFGNDREGSSVSGTSSNGSWSAGLETRLEAQQVA